MADRLTGDVERLLAMRKAGNYGEAAKLARSVAERIQRESTQRPKRAPTRPAISRRMTSARPVAGADFVRFSTFAHELRVDPRTLWKQLKDEPFVHRLGPRSVIIDRAAYWQKFGNGTHHPAA